MSIYTKTGDSGETLLLCGRRVSKSCVELRVIGELDELNAVLGIIVSILRQQPCHFERGDGSLNDIENKIIDIQKDIIIISSEIASLQTRISKTIEKIGKEKISEIEHQIDRWESQLPELKNFIIPGGSLPSAYLHLARAVCRRAERALVVLGKQKKVRAELFIYLNRLSDFLFMAARWANFQFSASEVKMTK